MSENKKYYYMKLKENFFSSERMVVLEMMPDGILYSNLLLKMYLMSLKHNGILLLHENLPHTPQTIATFTRHQIGTVERALQIFLKLGFVELLTDGAYYMPDIQLLVGRSSTEAERKRRERLRLQAQKLLSNSKADICPPENRDKEIREQKCARTNKAVHAGAVSYAVPKSCVSVREPFSDERRRAASERAKNAGYTPPARSIYSENE